MEFASRLKELRKKHGYTQSTLAQALGVSNGTIAMWETGKRTPDYTLISQLSDMFDRRIDYILGFSDDPTSPKLTTENIEQFEQWETQDELIDVFRQYLRLDTYGKMNVRSLLKREMVRCQEQGTEENVSGIKIGIQYELADKEGSSE